MTDVTQVQYKNLQQIANHFSQQGDCARRVMHDLQHQLDVLQNGAWDTDAAHAYFHEMNNDVMPSVNKLVVALNRSSDVTQEIIRIFQATEEEASGYWNGADSGGFAGGLFGGVSGVIGGIDYGPSSGSIEQERIATTNRLMSKEGQRVDGGLYGDDWQTADVLMVMGIESTFADQEAAYMNVKDAFGAASVAGIYNESGRESVPMALQDAITSALYSGHMSATDDIMEFFVGERPGESTLSSVVNIAAGISVDVPQSLGDIYSAMGIGRLASNPAVDSLVDVLRARSGQEFTVSAHSQGTLIVGAALARAKAEGIDVSQLNVVTFAAPAPIFPSWDNGEGPSYEHYLYYNDPISYTRYSDLVPDHGRFPGQVYRKVSPNLLDPHSSEDYFTDYKYHNFGPPAAGGGGGGSW